MPLQFQSAFLVAIPEGDSDFSSDNEGEEDVCRLQTNPLSPIETEFYQRFLSTDSGSPKMASLMNSPPEKGSKPLTTPSDILLSTPANPRDSAPPKILVLDSGAFITGTK